jgi:rod shape-determining protein MreC
MIQQKIQKKNRLSSRRKFLLPGIFLLISFLLMILPLEGFVSSVKAVLSYIFIPQIRTSHETVKYAQDVHRTVRELLSVHQENQDLKQRMETAQLLISQAENVMAENERLNKILEMGPQRRWSGEWAHVAYREPTQWNTVIIDKGANHGIRVRSAVLSVGDGQECLAGVVVEVTDTTAKVLLVTDEDFSASVQIGKQQETGLLQGGGLAPAHVKYIPLIAHINSGDTVYTASTSSIFPAGILVGKVSKVGQDDSFQTALTVEIEPQLHAGAVKELFVITKEGEN